MRFCNLFQWFFDTIFQWFLITFFSAEYKHQSCRILHAQCVRVLSKVERETMLMHTTGMDWNLLCTRYDSSNFSVQIAQHLRNKVPMYMQAINYIVRR